eukprot:11330141-Karenia_brevis.AAC.1
MGHVARSLQQERLRMLLEYRNQYWWDQQKTLSARCRTMHRQSGQQVPHPEDRIVSFCRHSDIDNWIQYAQNRQQWRNLLYTFAEYWM